MAQQGHRVEVELRGRPAEAGSRGRRRGPGRGRQPERGRRVAEWGGTGSEDGQSSFVFRVKMKWSLPKRRWQERRVSLAEVRPNRHPN